MVRPRFQAGTYTRAAWPNVDGEIEHEFDDYGNHRITIKGALGDWANYADVASYKYGDRLFVAYTDYWEGMPEIAELEVIVKRTLADIYRKDDNGRG